MREKNNTIRVTHTLSDFEREKLIRPFGFKGWQQRVQYHPAAGAGWTQAKNGAFALNSDFYRRSGGILESAAHYEHLFSPPFLSPPE